MERMKITVRTLSPVVMTTMANTTVMTETNDYLSGSVLRGAIAGAYIRQQGMGETAHEHKEFRELFFGGLKFVDAYLSVQGIRSIVLPRSLQKNKENTEIKDLLRLESGGSGFKSCKGLGVACREKKTISSVNVRKNISLHMSREQEDERISGRSMEGNIYNYEAINAGQEFVGWIVGRRELLKKLKERLNLREEKLVSYIGRSRYTQYGKCSIHFGDMETIADQLKAAEKRIVYLRLDTPFIPVFCSKDGKRQPVSYGFKATEVLQVLADELNEKTAQPGQFFLQDAKIFASVVELDNFVGIWGMKRPREMALGAGTVFALGKKSDWTEKDYAVLQEIMQLGSLSHRSEEGFGQISFWLPDNFVPHEEKSENKEPESMEIVSTVKDKARKILLKWMQEQLRMYASQDADKLAKQNDIQGLAHMFSRLEDILEKAGNCEDTDKRFGQTLEQGELRTGSPLDKNLQQIKLDGTMLKDILLGKAALPYEDKQRGLGEGEKMAKEIGADKHTDFGAGKLFYTYWQSFFRHARKQSVAGKEGTAE